jgi:hypothetical protein
MNYEKMLLKAKSSLKEEQLDLGFDDQSSASAVGVDSIDAIWSGILDLENLPQQDVPQEDVELILDDKLAFNAMVNEFNTDNEGSPVPEQYELDLMEYYLGAAKLKIKEGKFFENLDTDFSEYAKTTSTPSYDGYASWAGKNGKRAMAKSGFDWRVGQFRKAGQSFGQVGTDSEEDFDPTYDPSEIEGGSDILGSKGLAGGLETGFEGEIDTSRTTDDKYTDLREAVEDFISEEPSLFEMGEGTSISSAESKNRHLYISGSPGVGKSYEILTALREGQMHPFWEDKVHFEKSIIGSTVPAKALLAKFNQNLLVFDDATRMLTSPHLVEFMKTLLDMENPRVGRPKDKGEKKLVMSNMNDLFQDNPRAAAASSTKKESAIANYLDKRYNPFGKLNEAFGDEDEDAAFEDEDPYGDDANGPSTEREDMDGMGGDEEDEDPWTKNKGVLPFRSRVLFISNKPITELDSAIRSRFKKGDITLTAEEILDKIGSLKTSLYMKGKTDPVIMAARDGALYFLKLAIKAKGRPIGVTSKVTLKLIAPGLLTFRTFKDLCEAWVAIARSYGRKGIEWTKISTNPQLKSEFINRYIKTFNQNMSVTGEE